MKNRPYEIEEFTDDNTGLRTVRVRFGPHHFIQVDEHSSGKVMFALGATHHGFDAQADKVGGELEQIIEEIQKLHPTKTF